jgi:hypothetical protein
MMRFTGLFMFGLGIHLLMTNEVTARGGRPGSL